MNQLSGPHVSLTAGELVHFKLPWCGLRRSVWYFNQYYIKIILQIKTQNK